MTIVVHDAGILIDLLECNLEEEWCSLDFRLLTTSFVWREINRKHEKTRLRTFVDKKLLAIEAVSAEALGEIVWLQAQTLGAISLEDASVLFLSMEHGAILLSGDGLLRRHAESRGVEVHGILWMLETLIDHGSIDPPTAADRLEALLERGVSRLPREECKRLLTKWRKA